ncbi:MAG: phosphopantetheinyl transferase-like protein [Polaromonas sp.]|nr:phosphopantetheinyl transferase-like protein [Polaromonas sp.]
MTGVEVWLASPHSVTEHQWEVMNGWLDWSERAQAGHFRVAEDRDAYVLAHSLRRMGLSQALNIPVSKVMISASATGKPRWRGEHACPLHFSHAHTRGLAAFAMTGLGPLGVDVELLDAKAADLDLLRAWLALPGCRQRDAELGPDPAKQFYFYWTVLEAHCKAAGTGLSYGQALLECHARAAQVFEVSRVARGRMQQALALPLKTPTGWVGSVVTIAAHHLTSGAGPAIRYRQIHDFDWEKCALAPTVVRPPARVRLGLEPFHS